MFRGSKQGGGGNSFVRLTGLFLTKKGTGYVGSAKPDSFNTILKLMEEADAAGTELVFFVSPDKDAKNDERISLYVTVGRQRGQEPTAGNKFVPQRPKFGAVIDGDSATKRSADAPPFRQQQQTQQRGGLTQVEQMPRDPIDEFLEDVN